jgi:predicted nucleic acid-binding Zn ribbon protein
VAHGWRRNPGARGVIERGGKPTPIGEAVRSFLAHSELGARVEQAEVVREWAAIVGQQIAAVTNARGVTGDGTLIVYVRSNAWMNELSLRTPEVLSAVRARLPHSGIAQIRWLLAR